MQQKWENNKSKVCVVESSFGQKVWSTFPIAQSQIASPFRWQWRHCCLNEILFKKITFIILNGYYRFQYFHKWHVEKILNRYNLESRFQDTKVNLCRYFLVCLFMPLEIQLSRMEGFDPINWFRHTTFLCLFHAGKSWSFVFSEFSLGERWLFVLLILMALLTITVKPFLS
jgi:hypothetical protein